MYMCQGRTSRTSLILSDLSDFMIYHDNEEIEMNLRLYENNSEILRYQHK